MKTATVTTKTQAETDPLHGASLANATTPSVVRPLVASEFSHGYRDESGARHVSNARIQIAEIPGAPEKLQVSVESLDGSPVPSRTVSRGLLGAMGKLALGVAGILANKEAQGGLVAPGTMTQSESNSIARGLDGIRLNLYRPDAELAGRSGYSSAASVFAYDASAGIGMAVSSWHNFSLDGYDPLSAKLGTGENYNTDTSWVSIYDYVAVPESDLVMLFYKTDLAGAQTVQLGEAGIGTWTTAAGTSGFKITGEDLTRDGQAYGWTAPVIPGIFGGFDDTYFNRTDFDPYFYGVATNGRGMPGDSGGPVTFMIDTQIFLTGVVTGGTTDDLTFGFNLYTDFTPGLQDRIREEYGLRATAVPEPSSIAMLAVGLAVTGAGTYIWKKRSESGPDQV